MEDQEGFRCLNPQFGAYVVKGNFFEPSSTLIVWGNFHIYYPRQLVWILFGAVYLEN